MLPVRAAGSDLIQRQKASRPASLELVVARSLADCVRRLPCRRKWYKNQGQHDPGAIFCWPFYYRISHVVNAATITYSAPSRQVPTADNVPFSNAIKRICSSASCAARSSFSLM